MSNLRINDHNRNFEIIREQISHLTNKQIDDVLKKYVGIANDRVSRIEAHKEVYSPAYNEMAKARKQDKLQFTTDPGSYQLKRKELRQALDFIEDDTSTLAGANRFKKQVKETLGISDKKLTNTQLSNIFYLINQAEELNPVLVIGSDYSAIGQEIYEAVKSYDFHFSDYDDLEEEYQDSINKTTQTVLGQLEAWYKQSVDDFNKNMSGGADLYM